MRFQVLTATKFKITFLWDVMTTCSADINRNFVTPMQKGGNDFLRNVYTYQTEQSHILFKRLDSVAI
jgi:hypothetical protein